MGLSRPTRFERITRLGPAIACVTAVFTLTVCIILVKAQGHNTGGIVWPYLSDIGREAPEYYVMAVGLCTAGMGLFATTLHLFRLMQGLTHLRGASRAHMKRSLWVSLFSGTLSSAALCIGGAFTESAYPTLHFVTDVIFFLLGLTYCTVVTVMFNILWRSRADDPSALLLPRLRLSLRGKLVS
eukprot:UC1_evm1s900